MATRKMWSAKQDEVFRRITNESQNKNWTTIAKRLARQFGFKKRTGKQCRERWYNHLDPELTKKAWSKAEEEKMLSLHKIHGNRWTVIAEEMTGRSDNNIKNYFYSTVRRNLRRMGKYCGSKNSTGLMREIKPSTMTRIFGNFNQDNNENLYVYLQAEGLSLDFLRDSCQNIRDQIITFSSFKPKKNDRISEEEKRKYEQVFWLIKKVNQIYEKIRQEERSNQTQKQLFRHYYHQMKKESSEEENEEDSQEQDMLESDIQETPKQTPKEIQRITQGNQLRPTRKTEIVTLPTTNNTQSMHIKNTQDQHAEREFNDSNQQSLNYNRGALESTLQNIVQYAQEIEFNDPDFNIEINQQRQKTSENNLQLYMSNMSLKSPGFGTPLSQVNFFNSPKNNRISCLHDYLMRMSNSNREEFCLGLSGEGKEMDHKRQG